MRRPRAQMFDARELVCDDAERLEESRVAPRLDMIEILWQNPSRAI